MISILKEQNLLEVLQNNKLRNNNPKSKLKRKKLKNKSPKNNNLNQSQPLNPSQSKSQDQSLKSPELILEPTSKESKPENPCQD